MPDTKNYRADEVKAQVLLDKFIEESDLNSGEKFRLRRMVNDLVLAACKHALAIQRNSTTK